MLNKLLRETILPWKKCAEFQMDFVQTILKALKKAYRRRKFNDKFARSQIKFDRSNFGEIFLLNVCICDLFSVIYSRSFAMI